MDYERYEKIRTEKGYKDSDVSKGTGIGGSTFSDWKSGRSCPKTAKLEKIADFLGVSIDYLTGKESPSYYVNEETADIAQKIFENKDLRVLFDAAADASASDLQMAHSMLMALKKKERGDIE